LHIYGVLSYKLYMVPVNRGIYKLDDSVNLHCKGTYGWDLFGGLLSDKYKMENGSGGTRSHHCGY
jgi:hypothetical protein